MEPTNEAELIDEDPPQDVIDEPPPAAVPPTVVGDAFQAGMGAQLGTVPPIVSLPPSSPPPLPDDVIVEMLQRRRDELATRVGELEKLINFVVSEDDLAVRVGKIERFLGVIGARL